MTDLTTGPRIGLIAIGSFDHDLLSKSLADIPLEIRPLITGLFVPVVETSGSLPGRDGYATTADLKRLVHLAEDSRIAVTTVTFAPEDARYGAIQKVAFSWALDKNLDIAVVIHASGHFPLQSLGQMIEPVANGDAGSVFARRVNSREGPRSERISWWKFKGNRYLSSTLERIVGRTSNEWTCPFRAYSTRVLRSIPFLNNSDHHVFDLEMQLGCVELDEKMAEVEVPVVSDDAFTLRDCIRLAKDALVAALRYRFHKMGFGTGSTAFNSPAYDIKVEENSSHEGLLRWFGDIEPGDILDVGCSDGTFGELLERVGHTVTGIDIQALPGIDSRVSRFVEADLEQGLSQHFDSHSFDMVILADVLEHVRSPGALLREAKAVLKPDGRILVSIPNIGHWYGRLKVGFGIFSYDRRGLFDSGHLRFFTRVMFQRLAAVEQLQIVRFAATRTPLVDILTRGMESPKSGSTSSHILRGVSSLLSGISTAGIRIWPTLFGYQLLFELRAQSRGNPELVHFVTLQVDGTTIHSENAL
jgi:2-polyprenyl-3-methyl-5-hydroxy-6-metoxy-1,4-benzoquinol methylase